MGIVDDIDREVKKVKENPDVIKFKKGLEKGANTFKEEWEKNTDKDSEIIDVKYTSKNLDNKTNSYSQPKFCPKCGANTKPNYKFCKNCGHQLIGLKQTGSEIEKDTNDFSIGMQDGSEIEKDTNDFSIGMQDGSEIEKDNRNFNIANKLETEDYNKGLKIPISYKNNDKPKKSIAENVEFKKQENYNPNVDGNIKTEIEESINSYSIADEIYKFYELKEKGIITSDEFEKKKRQLLDQ